MTIWAVRSVRSPGRRTRRSDLTQPPRFYRIASRDELAHQRHAGDKAKSALSPDRLSDMDLHCRFTVGLGLGHFCRLRWSRLLQSVGMRTIALSRITAGSNTGCDRCEGYVLTAAPRSSSPESHSCRTYAAATMNSQLKRRACFEWRPHSPNSDQPSDGQSHPGSPYPPIKQCNEALSCGGGSRELASVIELTRPAAPPAAVGSACHYTLPNGLEQPRFGIDTWASVRVLSDRKSNYLSPPHGRSPGCQP